MLTLAQLQTSSFQTASGFCTTNPDFLEIVNDVIPRLANRGDWPGFVMPVRLCISNGCVTFPRYVGQVRRMNACKSTIAMHNNWYEFLAPKGRRSLHEWEGWCGQERSATMQYRAPVYNDIYGPNCTVRVCIDVQADIGVGVQIFGTDNNNQRLQTKNADGTWSDGITITAAIPYGSSSTFVSRIDRVVKPITQGNVRLYAYDSVANVLFDLAVYEPSEVNPSYLRYQVEAGKNWGTYGCQTGCQKTIIALVKLQFIPVVAPSDGIIFLEGSLGAIRLAVKARKEEDAGNPSTARQYWASAIEELNRCLEDSSPDDQFAATNNVFAGRTFRNRAF